jgi:hypothetical protein
MSARAKAGRGGLVTANAFFNRLAALGLRSPPPWSWSRGDLREMRRGAALLEAVSRAPADECQWRAMALQLARVRSLVVARDPNAWPALRRQGAEYEAVDLTTPVAWGAARLAADLSRAAVAASDLASCAAADVGLAAVAGWDACDDLATNRAMTRLRRALPDIHAS